MEDVDVAHFQDFSSCLVFDTLIISLALVLGSCCKVFFCGKHKRSNRVQMIRYTKQ